MKIIFKRAGLQIHAENPDFIIKKTYIIKFSLFFKKYIDK